ncbi:MAG: shikimate dehydrogenase [Mycobacteriaceae bacterium]
MKTNLRRAAVLGSPVQHSRSPQLHLAAYEALGLSHWMYERIECTAGQLPMLVSSFGSEWVGLSVTMPAKVAALRFAHRVSERAEIVGSANTLVHKDYGWFADCTDIDGVAGALDELEVGLLGDCAAVVIGAGGTARPALAALAARGVSVVTMVVRDSGRAQESVTCAKNLGISLEVISFDDHSLAVRCAEAAVVISTVPSVGVENIAETLALCPRVLDVIYNPWPTALARAVTAAGGLVVGGLSMLLHQAYGQVEQFTGLPAPKAVMARALG